MRSASLVISPPWTQQAGIGHPELETPLHLVAAHRAYVADQHGPHRHGTPTFPGYQPSLTVS